MAKALISTLDVLALGVIPEEVLAEDYEKGEQGMEKQNPIIVNHGNVFNTGDWYTFHCPKCESQLNPGQLECSCGQKIEFKK